MIVAFTYNGHREKMRIIGKEGLLEPLNRAALQIANDVAVDVPKDQEPSLVAGNISNSNIWNPQDIKSQQDAWNQRINYLGVCCGAAPIYIRKVAEAMGRKPPASRYSENMEKHFMYGTDKILPKHVTEYGNKA